MPDQKFKITILGRTLEHLGVQMYKKRTNAIAELIANSWDAGARNVYVSIPNESEYNSTTSTITIEDDGIGMNEESIENQYLVVGRNRRQDGQANVRERPVMGRKGIGKLAGFGVAQEMEITTWAQKDKYIQFKMNIENLKAPSGQTQIKDIPYKIVTPENVTGDGNSGTLINLRFLKHKTPLNEEILKETIARRFSRKVKGEMNIFINGKQVTDPQFELRYEYPESGRLKEHNLSDGNNIRFWWGLAKTTIRSPENRGFTILVNGKTAQAPNFFFNVEGTATGQHGTKRLIGVIEADYLDEGIDDESDLVSTDRQEIDWENERTNSLREWGERTVRDALYKNLELAGESYVNNVLEIDEIKERLERFEGHQQSQIKKVLRTLGKSEPDDERAVDLAKMVIRVYEYRDFHDSIDKIESIDEPEVLQQLLEHMHEWKTIESNAIMNIINGRLSITEKFYKMVVNDAPETSNRTPGSDNMHDLIAGYPWLLNPEWQILDEEKSISRQLREWHHDDIQDADSRLRYDFLALHDSKTLAVIEIKRTDHPLELDELQKLNTYKSRLESAEKGRNIIMVMIYGGNCNFSERELDNWKKRDDTRILTWGEIYQKTKQYYVHYQSVLNGDLENRQFSNSSREVLTTRRITRENKIYRSPAERKKGLGPNPESD